LIEERGINFFVDWVGSQREGRPYPETERLLSEERAENPLKALPVIYNFNVAQLRRWKDKKNQ